MKRFGPSASPGVHDAVTVAMKLLNAIYAAM